MSPSEHDTSPTLLRRAADWSDRSAWNKIHFRYDALLDRWSRRALDNPSDVGEFKQILWIEIARRLVEFRYDPNRSFRNWLKTLHASRVADFRKSMARSARRSQGYREVAMIGLRGDRAGAGQMEFHTGAGRESPDHGADSTANARLAMARDVVQTRFTPRSWSIFWAISMEDRSIRETADEFGMTYAATFAAYSRVRNALKAELERNESP